MCEAPPHSRAVRAVEVGMNPNFRCDPPMHAEAAAVTS